MLLLDQEIWRFKEQGRILQIELFSQKQTTEKGLKPLKKH
jgi:hypothetical protein